MAMVLWSGGLDSTLVLVNQLKEKYNKEAVRSVAINHLHMGGNAGNLLARQRLLRHFKQQRWELEHHEIKIETEAFQGGCFYAQPPIWILNAVSCLNSEENLLVGYIRNDDIWHYKAELLAAFDSLQRLRGGSGKLLFPLEWEHKYKVLAKMRDLKLANKCWWCEGVGPRACRHCVSCETHAAASAILDKPVPKMRPCLNPRA